MSSPSSAVSLPAADRPAVVAFQGAPGAYSDQAAKTLFPQHSTLPCTSFEDAFEAVHGGQASLAVLPVDNSIAGRVADIHHLLPDGGLHIVGEFFLPIRHCLLARPGTRIQDIKTVHSHVHALSQCRQMIRKIGARAIVETDTAGSARMIADGDATDRAAIASSLAAEAYGLEILQHDVQDAAENVTRFLVMATKPHWPMPGDGKQVTSFSFRVRNIPASLYKVLGGFATNGINMTKLESYMVNGTFVAAQFYADVEGHPEEPAMRLAMDELKYFATSVNILGVYPAHPYRLQAAQQHRLDEALAGL